MEPEASEQAETEHSTVPCVALGVENLAVPSTGAFRTADEFNHWKREHEKRRGSVQQTGSRWAHQRIEAVGRREVGRSEQYLHRVANEPIAEARENGCSVIGFDGSTGIRDRLSVATRSHVWAFRRLYEHVEYEADNVAGNSGPRHPRRNQTGGDGGAPVGVCSNSGTLNANGEYTPPSEEGGREPTLKAHDFGRGLAYSEQSDE